MSTPTYEAPIGVPVITGKFQVMPPPTLEEYQALDKSICELGVQVPPIEDENGDIIDGHYRDEIATRRGITYERTMLAGLTHAEKIGLAMSLNINRRHLNSEQKRELLATSIKADPQASDREHAKRTGSSDKTAAKVRVELEDRSEIPNVETRTDTKGRKQPAKKAAPKPQKSEKEIQLDAIIRNLTQAASGFEYLSSKRMKITLTNEPDLNNALARLDRARPPKVLPDKKVAP